MNKLRRFNKILLIVVIVLLAECVVVLKAEALTAGPNNPGSVVNNTGIGSVAWTNPSNALTQNSSYAYVQVSQNTSSNYLNFSNYGFSIPPDATIDGIEVTIYGYMQSISGSGGYDTWFQLRKAGALTGTYKFPYIAYIAGSVATAGGSSDLWGTTWTPADINNSSFGISAWLSVGSQTLTMMENIDAIMIRVYYTTSSIPTLVSPTKSSITNTTATLGATVSSDGGASISSRGVCYALTATDNTPGFSTAGGSTPEAGVTCISTSGTTGAFTIPVTGLTESSAYTYRGYARNSVGNGYSGSDSFTTYGKPTVTTSAAGSITNSQAVLNSSINPNGLSTNVYYLWGEAPGVECSLQPNTLNGPTGLTGTSVLSPNASTLSVSPNKTYYFCVMATNSAGTSYGSVLDFITPAANPNSYVYMDAGSALGTPDCYDDSAAPCPVMIVGYGGESQTSTYLAWDSPSGSGPTPSGYDIAWCTGSGCTPSTLITNVTPVYHHTGRTCNTTYGYNIRAKNAAGSSTPSVTIYATTSACVSVPTVTSPTVSSIGPNSATLGGNVTSDGGASLTARGTCWGTGNPPSTNCKDAGGTSIGTFTDGRVGMAPGTLYYFRAYATNSSGLTGYSTVSSFTTSSLLANGSACSSGGQCQSGNCYVDNDNDRYAPSSGSSTCRASSQIGGTDCYDGNANAYPGQSNSFSSHRGDGSFDYDCNGSITYSITNTYYAGNGPFTYYGSASYYYNSVCYAYGYNTYPPNPATYTTSLQGPGTPSCGTYVTAWAGYYPLYTDGSCASFLGYGVTAQQPCR